MQKTAHKAKNLAIAFALALAAIPARAQLMGYMGNLNGSMPATGGDLAGSQAGILGSVSALSAYKPRLNYGGLTLNPYYNVTGIYDSNIFLSPRSGGISPVVGSWITDENLGLKGAYQLNGRHAFDFSYDFASLDYQSHPQVNNAIDQAVGAGYAYTGPGGLTAKVRDNYVNTTDPASTEVTQRYKRWENLVGAQTEYSPSQTGFVSIDAEHQTDKYITNDPAVRALLDRFTDTLGGKVGWYAQPKTKVYVGYHAVEMHFTDQAAGTTSRNNLSSVVDAGIEGRIAPKVTAQFETGLTYTHFDAAPAGGQNTARFWNFNGGVYYTPTERTNINLTLRRDLQPAVLGGSQYYLATTAGLGIAHRLPPRLTVGANGSIERDNYQTPLTLGGVTSNTYFNAYVAGAFAAYDIKPWARLAANYMYVSRFSNFGSLDYIDHRTSLTLSLFY